jgi:hypothetical protein
MYEENNEVKKYAQVANWEVYVLQIKDHVLVLR